MRIIGINKNAKCKMQNAKIQAKIKTFIFCLILLPFTFYLLPLLSGCMQKSGLDEAREYTRQAQDYYQRAIDKYEELIAEGKDKDLAYFELGLLYYRQGEYGLASRNLSNTTISEAEKYLALSLYRINDFTEAKEAFKKIENPDEETLYYYGEVCEELNLYDEALDIYSKINEEPFRTRAQDRIQLITRLGEKLSLENLSPRLQEIITNAPPAEKYPNAGALILLCDEKVELAPENNAVFQAHLLIKILNERGKQVFSEIVISYDSTYEKVELEYARTIRPDGIVVPVGSRHIRDVSKYLNFPLYSNVRARIVSFPEIAEGCVIEYKYKIYRNQLVNEKDFVLSYRLQELEPIIQAKFRLITQAQRPLHYKVLNSDYNTAQAKLEPTIKESAEYKEYLWEFKDIPAIIPEANMPPNSKINPIILISTFVSWQEVYKWWWGLAQDKIQADEAIKQKVKELTEDKATVLDKVRAIYNFCAEDIRYVAVEYGQAGYEPHKAIDIFFNKYGDCKDQAILLVTMLQEAGIKSYPVLIGTDEYIDLQEEFPSINFNHCIVCVEINEELVYLDPTCSTCSFGNLPSDDQNRKVLVFTEAGYRIETTPIYPARYNSLRKILRMEINPNETIKAERMVYTFGQYDASQRIWLKYSSQEATSENIKQVIQGIVPVARLINYDIRNLNDLNKSVILSFSFSGREYWIKAGNLRLFPPLTRLDTSLVAKQERRYPLDLGLPNTVVSELEVVFPRKFKLKYLPADLKLSNPWLDLSVEYSVKENCLYFKQVTRIKKRFVFPAEYPEFKEFMENVSTQIRERVIFQRG